MSIILIPLALSEMKLGISGWPLNLENLEFDQNLKNNLENLEYDDKIEKNNLENLEFQGKIWILVRLDFVQKKFIFIRKFSTIVWIFFGFFDFARINFHEKFYFFCSKTLNFTKKNLEKSLKTLNFNKYYEWPPFFNATQYHSVMTS